MYTAMSLIQHARTALPWMRGWLLGSLPLRRSLRLGSSLAFEPCRIPLRVPIPQRRPRPTFPRVIWGSLALLALAAPMAQAQNYGWRDDDRRSRSVSTVNGNLVDVRMLVDGEQAPIYLRPGQDDRLYFQAFRGRNYALQLRNRTNRRVGVLIAVDGLNVVNGDRSRLSRNEPMYVLDPWESATIRGWRTSLSQVRRFVFVDEERSYAERTGQANGDMGWIRVLAFQEAGNPRVRGVAPYEGRRDEGDWERMREEPPVSGAPRDGVRKAEPNRSQMDGPTAESYPGTGWGDRKHDPVSETWFEPVSRPSDHLVFRYEYERGLRALGIVPRRGRLLERDRGELGFARPPRW